VGRVKVGGESTRLIVLRGNSGSGKSSVAAEVRARHGRGIALVGQDNLRRVVLRERDVPGGANIGLIDTVARYALGHGFHVIIDGILRATTYGAMLDTLHHDHQGISRFYYFDVPFEETMRRHAARPQATEFGREEMSGWYRELDLLPSGIEQVIPAASSLDTTVLQMPGCPANRQRRRSAASARRPSSGSTRLGGHFLLRHMAFRPQQGSRQRGSRHDADYGQQRKPAGQCGGQGRR
jgi:predicted kinase